MTPYSSALREAMSLVAAQPNAIILGQSVAAGGTAMRTALEHVDQSILLELPVFEETQLGMSIGLALAGYLPLSVYPRQNFLLSAVNQLVNHLDKLPAMGAGNPKVLIRVGTPTATPLHPGPQHLGDFSYQLAQMLTTVTVLRLRRAEDVVRGYQRAIEAPGSFILVEYASEY